MIKQKCTTCEVTRYAVDKNSFPLNLVKMSVIFVNQNFILEVTWICYPIILAISWHFCSSYVRTYGRIYYPVRMYRKFSYYVRRYEEETKIRIITYDSQNSDKYLHAFQNSSLQSLRSTFSTSILQLNFQALLEN